MREGLTSEFPAAARAAAWTRGRAGGRRPAVWAEPVLWATISGIGAGFLVGAVTQALVGLTSETFQALRAPLPALFPLITIAGLAAAAAVAIRAGGIPALFLYVAWLALGVALGIGGVMTFCERSGGEGFPPLLGTNQCTVPGFVVSLWPQFIGIGLGVALSRAVTARGHGINSILRIAGGYAVAQSVMGHVWAATGAQSTNPTTSGLTVGAAMVAAAVGAGVIATHVPHGIRSAAIVAGISLLPWLTFQVPNSLRSDASDTPEFVVPMLIGIAIQPIAAVFLILSAAITSRARFTPRDTA